MTISKVCRQYLHKDFKHASEALCWSQEDEMPTGAYNEYPFDLFK